MLRMVDIIAKKRDGGKLSREEIEFFVKGYTEGSIPDYQASALLMAICLKGMDMEEATCLTMAMVASGEQIDLSAIEGIKVDKHSTGGVGDKTTLVLGPIVASCGVKVAKMSGRGLGHTGGTIDKLESIPGFNTQLTRDEFIRAVKETGIAVAGQTGNLVPADEEARELAEAMVSIGTRAGKKVAAVITDMDRPLGYAVGNALEVREAIDVLKGKGPADVREVCLTLAAKMLELAGKGSFEQCREMAAEAIESGAALRKLEQMIRTQGGLAEVVRDPTLLPQATHVKAYRAGRGGYITAIQSERLGIAAMMLGAGRATKESAIDPAAGIVLLKKPGDSVKEGDVIMELHANDEALFESAIAELDSAVAISDKVPEPTPLIIDFVP